MPLLPFWWWGFFCAGMFSRETANHPQDTVKKEVNIPKQNQKGSIINKEIGKAFKRSIKCQN
jgi:hypothetical protein